MLYAVLLVLAGATIAFIYVVVTHRRRTPYLEIDLDALPALDEDLAALAGLTGGAVSHGNRCEVIQNGAFFDAIERDIARAKHTVHLETFVWTKGALEKRMVRLLSEKVKAGVHVRVLMDAVGGSSADSKQLEALQQAGVEFASYCGARFWNLRRFNHRTHRKLLIVDGEIGYTFGHGVADQWLGDGEDKEHWRDTALRLEGPAVFAMQAVFMQNWIEETHCVLSGEGCFPQLEPRGECDAHIVESASGEAVSSVALLYTLAIASARREVIIQNPYFAPDDGVCKLLGMMVKRGVAVHLMVPGKNTDSPFVRRAGCRLYASLLESGVRLYEFEPTLLHQKIVIIDDIWSHVGSTNFDSRSLALNEEVGVGVRDATLARELKKAFKNDLQRSREITREQWRRRPWRSKAFDWLAYQLHDQL